MAVSLAVQRKGEHDEKANGLSELRRGADQETLEEIAGIEVDGAHQLGLLLAGLVTAPSRLNPLRNPEAAAERLRALPDGSSARPGAE